MTIVPVNKVTINNHNNPKMKRMIKTNYKTNKKRSKTEFEQSKTNIHHMYVLCKALTGP